MSSPAGRPARAPATVRAGGYRRPVPPAEGRARAPADHLVDGAWPTGRLHGPPYVHYAAALARAVDARRVALGLGSVRALAKHVGVPHNTLSRVLAGRAVPDLVTIALLEVGLGIRLLPDPREVPRPDVADPPGATAAAAHKK